jgi:hypothetical protein
MSKINEFNITDRRGLACGGEVRATDEGIDLSFYLKLAEGNYKEIGLELYESDAERLRDDLTKAIRKRGVLWRQRERENKLKKT